MKKLIRIFPFLIMLVLAIPIFRNLYEKFKTSEILKAYSIITDRELLYSAPF